MGVELFVRDLGGAGLPPLVVLHGLYGSSRNWVTAGRGLSEQFHVLALDLRNHGQSPHRHGMRYDALVEDVLTTLDGAGIDAFTLMGHSLGGKVAMTLACRRPQRVDALWVLDIAPREYAPDTSLLDALLAVDLSAATRRADVEEQVAAAIPDRGLRLFLLTNLVRSPEGAAHEYVWQADLEALREAMPEIRANPLAASDRYAGPTTFLVGGRSGYVREADRDAILRHFPRARIVELGGVGHNVHAEDPERFLSAVLGPGAAADGGDRQPPQARG